MTSVEKRHDEQHSSKKRPATRFVDSDEFCRLLVGFKRLVRADDPHYEVRGLLDLDSDTLYMIENNKLSIDS